MQQLTTQQVSRSEWRWVILVGGILVAVTLLPYALAFSLTGGGNVFMGALYNPLDGATYFAKIREGLGGAWLYTLAHTPEPHSGALVHSFYLFLGHLANLLNLSPVLIFHIARLVTSFTMFLAIYQLASTIWNRKRPRRLFFWTMAVGSGLGWLFVVIFPAAGELPIDFTIPEAIPFYAALANPHFPLAIGLVAMIASIFIPVFRPNFDQQPTLTNGGGTLILIVIVLCLVQPQAWVPIAGGLCAYTFVQILRTRGLPKVELNWVILAVLPALPFMIYYIASVTTNPAYRVWNSQNLTPSPGLDKYLLGFGLPLLVAVPGIWRAVRSFSRDGDRFMLIWLAVNAAMLYAPLNLQRRLAIGMFIPIAYFAVRALEEQWLHWIAPRWRAGALLALFALMIPSNALILGLPMVGVLNSESGLEGRLLLPADYVAAIGWIRVNAARGDVVLAAETPSLWLPGYADVRVVFAHPYETLHAAQKAAEVRAWFDGQTCQQDADGRPTDCQPVDAAFCADILSRYHVRYVITRQAGESDFEPAEGKFCIAALGWSQPAAQFADVSIYAVSKP